MNKKQVLALSIFTGTFGVLLIMSLVWGVLFGGSGGNIFSSLMPLVIWVLAFLGGLAAILMAVYVLLWYPAEGLAAAAVGAPATTGSAAAEEGTANDAGVTDASVEGEVIEGDGEFDADESLDAGEFEGDEFDDDAEAFDDFEDDEDFR